MANGPCLEPSVEGYGDEELRNSLKACSSSSSHPHRTDGDSGAPEKRVVTMLVSLLNGGGCGLALANIRFAGGTPDFDAVPAGAGDERRAIGGNRKFGHLPWMSSQRQP